MNKEISFNFHPPHLLKMRQKHRSLNPLLWQSPSRGDSERHPTRSEAWAVRRAIQAVTRGCVYWGSPMQSTRSLVGDHRMILFEHRKGPLGIFFLEWKGKCLLASVSFLLKTIGACYGARHSTSAHSRLCVQSQLQASMLGYNLNLGLVILWEMWFSNRISWCNTVIKVICDFRVCAVSWQTFPGWGHELMCSINVEQNTCNKEKRGSGQ